MPERIETRTGLLGRLFGRQRKAPHRPCVVVTGSDGGFGNLGDELLARATRQFYAEYLDRFDVTIAQLNPPERAGDGFTYVPESAEGLAAIDPKRVVLLHYYGGGYLNRYWYDAKIALYRDFVARGLPPEYVVFTGQGLGPFTPEQAAELADIARRSLQFGTRDRLVVDGVEGAFTFDESIALYSPELTIGAGRAGTTVALSIRTGTYVGVDGDLARSVLGVLDASLGELGWDAIAFGMVANDRFDEGALLERAVADAGARTIRSLHRPAGFEELTSVLSGCRVAVTTSYHVALVSLYTGTPVVVLCESEYYRLKFGGLAEVLDTPLLTVVTAEQLGRDVLEAAAAAADAASIASLRGALVSLRGAHAASRAPIARVLEERGV